MPFSTGLGRLQAAAEIDSTSAGTIRPRKNRIAMLWRIRKSDPQQPAPTGFIKPAQPVLVTSAPKSDGWLHEVKHDGWRMVAKRWPDGRVSLWSRNAVSWTERLPLIRAAMLALPVRSVTLDGECIAPRRDLTSDFGALRSPEGRSGALLMAFDILELNGEDMRRHPLWHRRDVLQGVALFQHAGLSLSEPLDAPGDVVFRHACSHGLEGIVSKRLTSLYRSGRTSDWVKTKCTHYHRAAANEPGTGRTAGETDRRGDS
jgi:bifunctional non-homologous end joining protein LigD